MVSPSRCPPWQPERPGPTRREPRRAQRSYTTRRDTILVSDETQHNVANTEEVSAPPASARKLDNINLLEDLPVSALLEIEPKCRWIEFGAHETVLDRDDNTHEVYFIVAGTVRVMNYLDGDREVALADLQACDHFGELSAVDSLERSARVVGSDHCVIAALPREQFLTLLLEHPRVALRLLDHFANIIRSMNQRVSSLSSMTPHQRIYAELLRMAEPNPRGDGSWVIRTVPHHNEIASWSGTEKPEVAMAIGSLVRDGVLQRKHKTFKIKDHARSRLLVNM